MSTGRKAALALCTASLLAALAAIPASAEPILDLELKRASGPSVPVTHSDERLAYEAVITNTASKNPGIGTELTCEIGSVGGSPVPAVEIEWLRNGVPIPGTKGAALNAATYDVAPADAGKSLQCMATATSDPDGAGTAFAPIAGVGVSLPPVAVEPVPSPAPPSGTSGTGRTGPSPATPSGTATVTAGSNVIENVITAKGTGDLTAGSNIVTDVKTTSGAFFVDFSRQAITGPGIPTGTEIAAVEEVSPGILKLTLSKAATATTPDGALAAGALPFFVGQQISGAGISAGTVIDGYDGLNLTLSNDATASGTEVPITATATIGCKSPVGWSGTGLTWSFQWLRNGVPIAGATSANYTAQSADTEPPSILQCLATAKDAAGNEAVVVSAREPTRPRTWAPYEIPAIGGAEVAFNNKTEGPITFEAEFPPGTQVLRAFDEGTQPWSCTKQPLIHPSSVECTRSDSLPPGDSYPPIQLAAQVFRDAPDTLVTKASVTGGGSLTSPTAEDTVSGILPAAPWGFKAFETSALDSGGDEFTQAGGHPFSAGAELEFDEHVKAEFSSEAGFRAMNGSVRVVKTDIPPGFTGNPEALVEKCETVADVLAKPSTCPAASAVGGISLETSAGHFVNLPIYAIESERGTPAQFAFGVTFVPPGYAYTLTPELRPSDGYAISLLTSPVQKNPPLFGADAKLCGFGAEIGSASSDGETKFKRCLKPGEPGATERPFLTMPTQCGDPASATTHIYADTWEDRGNYAHDEHTIQTPQGCNALEFEPTIKARPTTNNADSPTGLDFDLTIPQNEDLEGTATAHLKKAVVTLPEGLAVNPSSANGLDACSPDQIKLGTNDPNACPDASKLGSVSVTTPILDHPLPGALYLATPHQNPFDSLLALYLVVEDAETGITIKLPGKVETDPVTGRITSSFDNNPEAPVERVELKLRSGAAAPLRTPVACGRYSTTSSLTPWSAPESGPPATPKDNWQISRGPGGSVCASSPPNSPGFEAGTTSPIAAAYSPFVLKLRREDGSQQFSALNVTPPPGLLANLSGVPYCPESSLAAAAAKTGKEEQAAPSCPAASQVGTVIASAGAGPAPYNAPGTAYLTGPYKGAPLSLAIVTPAVAGPFDLGNVVVRTALHIDVETARVTAVSDPLPTILQGIPLDVRAVSVSLDRPGFTLNPTSCDPMAVTGELTSTLNQIAPLSNRFQVAECSRLGFKPKLQISLKGKTKRGGHPALKATLTYPKGAYANISKTSVALPHSEFLEQAHIRTICTRVQFAADQCPQGSVYGKATATTPLLDQPLTGPVYLRSSDNPLPDMVVDLRGQIHVALVGRIDSHKGGIRSTFDSVPDAPVSRFVLEMQGGRKGLLVNSRDICRHVNRATASFTAHNGMELEARPALKAKCGKKARKGKQNRKDHRRG